MATKGDPTKFVDIEPTEASERAGEEFEKIRAEQRRKTFEAIIKPFKDLFSEAQVDEAFKVASVSVDTPEARESFVRTTASVKEWQANNKKTLDED